MSVIRVSRAVVCLSSGYPGQYCVCHQRCVSRAVMYHQGIQGSSVSVTRVSKAVVCLSSGYPGQ